MQQHNTCHKNATKRSGISIPAIKHLLNNSGLDVDLAQFEKLCQKHDVDPDETFFEWSTQCVSRTQAVVTEVRSYIQPYLNKMQEQPRILKMAS